MLDDAGLVQYGATTIVPLQYLKEAAHIADIYSQCTL